MCPFFQNLLPEGWLLEIATKKLKIAKDDDFGLLLATCAGITERAANRIINDQLALETEARQLVEASYLSRALKIALSRFIQRQTQQLAASDTSEAQ